MAELRYDIITDHLLYESSSGHLTYECCCLTSCDEDDIVCGPASIKIDGYYPGMFTGSTDCRGSVCKAPTDGLPEWDGVLPEVACSGLTGISGCSASAPLTSICCYDVAYESVNINDFTVACLRINYFIGGEDPPICGWTLEITCNNTDGVGIISLKLGGNTPLGVYDVGPFGGGGGQCPRATVETVTLVAA